MPPVLTSLCLLVTGALLGGCGGFSRGEPIVGADAGTSDGGTSDGGTTDGVTFADDVHPLLKSRCGGCHQSGGTAGSTTFRLTNDVEADLLVVASLVKESDPPRSVLLTKATGTGHGGGSVISTTSSEYNLLIGWIGAGLLP